MSKMITLRLSAERTERLDELVSTGVYATRAAAVTEAIDRLLAEAENGRIDRAIVAGYRRVPPNAHEDAYATASARESVREEPW